MCCVVHLNMLDLNTKFSLDHKWERLKNFIYVAFQLLLLGAFFYRFFSCYFSSGMQHQQHFLWKNSSKNKSIRNALQDDWRKGKIGLMMPKKERQMEKSIANKSLWFRKRWEKIIKSYGFWGRNPIIFPPPD